MIRKGNAKEGGWLFCQRFLLDWPLHMNTLMIVKIKNGEENEYIL